MSSFEKSTRTLMSGLDVFDAGTLRIDTSRGANLSAQAVIDAVCLLDERRQKKTSVQKQPSPFQKQSKVRPQGPQGKEHDDGDTSLKDERDSRRVDLNKIPYRLSRHS